MDGCVIVAGKACCDSSDLSHVLPADFDQFSPDQIARWWALNVRDVGALYVRDTIEGWVACYPDPLGAAIAFTYHDGQTSAISTDMGSLVSVLQSRGISLHPSVAFQAERLLLGNGGLHPSSFREIDALRAFHYAVLVGDVVRVHALDLDEYYADKSKHDLFEMLVADVCESIHAIAQSNHEYHIAHLTGGFDSRLVLSAIMSEGLVDRFRFFCSGPEGSKDRRIADGLTASLGLRRSAGAGLAMATPDSDAERLVGPIFNAAGLMETGMLGREPTVSIAAMGGGYGEILRTFFGNRTISRDGITVSPDAVRSSFLMTHDLPIKKHAADEIVDLLVQRLTTLVMEKDMDFAPDALYTDVRNRYHMGQGSLMASRFGSRFNPLYSVAGYYLASRVTQRVRGANVIGVDLMEHLCPRLLRYPFDKERFSEELLTQRKLPSPLEFSADHRVVLEAGPKSEVPAESALSEFLEAHGLGGIFSPTAEQRKQFTATANAVGVPYWQIASIGPAQRVLRFALELGSSSDEFDDYFDMDRIARIATTPLTRRPDIRALYALVSALCWLYLNRTSE